MCVVQTTANSLEFCLDAMNNTFRLHDRAGKLVFPPVPISVSQGDVAPLKKYVK